MGMAVDTGGGGKGAKPVINVTPLVDVVLVLLIIFMVIIPNVQDGKPIEMVNVLNAEKKDAKKEPFIITLALDGSFAIEDRDVSRAAMMNELRELQGADPKRKILVRGDARLPYKDVREVFHEIQQMGFAGVALAVGQQREWSDMGEK